MPTHRSAGSVLDAEGAAAGSPELATSEEWESFLRSRAGWATAPVPVVPAQGARRTGPLPVVTAFLPSQRSACSTGAPAAPARAAQAPAPQVPAAPSPASSATAAFLPAPRAAEPASTRAAGRSRGRRALGAPDAAPAAPVEAPAVEAPSVEATAAAAAPAAAVPAPSRRSGRRRADLPVAPLATTAPAEATRGGALPAAFLAEAPAAFLPELAGADEVPLARRARRRAQAPLDAEPPAPLPVRPGGRRAQRLAATDGHPAPEPAPEPAARPVLGDDTLTWAQQVEADDAVLLQLEQALTMPSAERSWTPSALPADVPRQRSGAPAGVPAVLPEVRWAAEPVAAPEATAPQDAVPAFTPARGRGAHRLPGRALSVLPQVGVVGVLGLATLVAPMVGDLLPASADGDTGATARTGTAFSAAPASAAGALVETGGAQQLSSAAKVAADGAQALVDGRTATQVVSRASARAQLAQQQAAEKAAADAAAAAKVAAEVAAAQHRAAVSALAPGCEGATPDVTGERNGRIPDSQLCSLGWQSGHRLRADAAVALAELDLAYREHFGGDISLTDTYRSYAEQVRVRREKPSLAARPGTSEHGWGLAVDMGGGVQNSDEHYDWLIENAPKYGWDHPAWARKGGAGPYEPWHWEYVAGEA